MSKTNQIVNLGVFYTKSEFVKIVWNFITPCIDKNTIVFDPACGYGIFLTNKTTAIKIGNDVDSYALSIAKKIAPDAIFFNKNALIFLNRKDYNIPENSKLIIVGNPPYNDLTSQAKKRMKKLQFEVHNALKTRDIGISFMRLFAYLKADYVAVLHPLSYLIKKTNFNLLKIFKDYYKLEDGIIISSKSFNLTSKASQFPIIIAFYKKHKGGMSFEYIKNFHFKTIEGKSFKLTDFQFIGDFIDKYPKKSYNYENNELLFYTLRDINALKRNKTFLEKPTKNAIMVNPNKLDYYIYVDVFKDFIQHIPYYLGNLDIIINTQLFEEYKKYFISYSIKKRPVLKKYYPEAEILNNEKTILQKYFKKLLGEHYR